MPLGILENHLNGQLLGYAVGKAMFCPDCDRLLDVSDSVLITADEGPAGISCGACWDMRWASLSSVEQAAALVCLDILDGREIDR